MMYASACTGAYIPVRKLGIFITFLVLILTTGHFIWNYEAYSEHFSECLEKNKRIENVDYIPGQQDYDSSGFKVVIKPKPWYLVNGTRNPEPATISKETGIRDVKLLPPEDPQTDRILNQMMFVPPNYETIVQSKKVKTILAFHGFLWWWRSKEGDPIIPGEHAFKKHKCPVDACRLTTNKSERQTADLVFFDGVYVPPEKPRPSKQIYALYFSEPPHKNHPITHPDVINWTITYRMDSTIAGTYDKFVYYDPRIKQMEQNRNYAENKTKKVAMFVTNCLPDNGRMDYAKELQKYIQVDIYGKCGNMTCEGWYDHMKPECHRLLNKDYKFYLAFENSNCKDYITEKFFVNGLGHDLLPIVMGAPPEDYERVAPLRSYIHVDRFSSPKGLAEYLHILDKNDDLYNSYFKWKGTGEFLGSWPKVLCRMCALLHDEYTTSLEQWYEDINEWWRGPGVCTKGSWRDFDINKANMTAYYHDKK